jgi:HTH-type transcriptional regulator/antitoxin HigA
MPNTLSAWGSAMATEPKIIKTAEQYRLYLSEVERLAAEDPASGTSQGDRLELLAKLVEDYEKDQFPFERPDPVDAILFRMEQQGLRQKDLAPLLGGKNRVSEILSRKRPLTLPMVRALSETLRIPADLLIREPAASYGTEESLEIPLSHLVKAGWFNAKDVAHLSQAQVVQHYLKPRSGPLYLRHTITYGSTDQTNKTNLRLWVGRVRELAKESRSERGTWRPQTIDQPFLAYVAQLSWAQAGPQLARQFLAEKGIAVIVLPALPKTKLDGAAMLAEDGSPIVGLTIRNDRLDSFWFTLLHELVHVWKHLPDTKVAITDESVEDEQDDEAREAEANRLAKEAFIPRSLWKRSEAFVRPSKESIQTLADKLHISPAVIAGRLRREKVGYSALTRLVGQGQVQRLFPDVSWE